MRTSADPATPSTCSPNYVTPCTPRQPTAKRSRIVIKPPPRLNLNGVAQSTPRQDNTHNSIGKSAEAGSASAKLGKVPSWEQRSAPTSSSSCLEAKVEGCSQLGTSCFAPLRVGPEGKAYWLLPARFLLSVRAFIYRLA